ncbi:hypothetical protein GN958_ATG18476 [Phytophthora infestans]|uniref:Uncharacterized protein n=1 Tax=Phytophthora infestans TaxID=4787 RepID=A0A8S9TZR6_PHYIN|nr:hypothetical protein GN958_ATG18476 [Phytophthora infestans]
MAAFYLTPTISAALMTAVRAAQWQIRRTSLRRGNLLLAKKESSHVLRTLRAQQGRGHHANVSDADDAVSMRPSTVVSLKPIAACTSTGRGSIGHGAAAAFLLAMAEGLVLEGMVGFAGRGILGLILGLRLANMQMAVCMRF